MLQLVHHRFRDILFVHSETKSLGYSGWISTIVVHSEHGLHKKFTHIGQENRILRARFCIFRLNLNKNDNSTP